MNLRTKFTLWVAALVTLVVCAVGAMTAVSERHLLKQEMAQQHRQLAERLARVCAESLYQNDLLLVNYLRTMETERGFRAAGFLDPAGVVKIHSDPRQIGRMLRSPDEKRAATSPGIFQQTYVSENGEMVLDIAAPVVVARERRGTARLFLSADALQQFLNQSLRRTLCRLAAITLAALPLGWAGSLLLARTMVKPIRRVVEGMRQVSKGRLDPIPLPDRSDELGWMGRELNVTIGKLKELDEMKRDFVAGVTHELKSPLAAIDNMANLFLDGTISDSPERRRDFFITIRNNTSRLMRLIEDLLTTAKLESKRMDLECAGFDIRPVIKEISDLYRPVADTKKIGFTIDLPPNATFVWADVDKVTQILNNLLSNAFKFTKEGTVELRVRPGSNQVEISVLDTGMGIAPSDRDRLFGKFYRAPKAKNIKGTGLGLYISKSFVEMHGGAIVCTPNGARGTRFSFTLPAFHSSTSNRYPIPRKP